MLNIYILIDPRTGAVHYVGATSLRLSTRLTLHLSKARHGGERAIYRWLRELLAEARRPLIQSIEQTEDVSREAFWITHYRNAGCSMVNTTDGGSGASSVSPSLAHRAKIAATLTGRKTGPCSKERRANISAALTGKHLSEGAKEKLRQANLGKKASPATRANISAGLRGKPKSPEHVAKVAAARRAAWARWREDHGDVAEKS